jgi:hypothetical protein
MVQEMRDAGEPEVNLRNPHHPYTMECLVGVKRKQREVEVTPTLAP